MILRRAGFTLVECVLAIGITSIVVVAVVGLLPAGLDAARIASNHTAEARIVERIRQQCEVAPSFGEFYFDALGRSLNAATADAVFAVRVDRAAGVTLPGDDAASLRSITITISDRVDGESLPDQRHSRVHQLILAPLANGNLP